MSRVHARAPQYNRDRHPDGYRIELLEKPSVDQTR